MKVEFYAQNYVKKTATYKYPSDLIRLRLSQSLCLDLGFRGLKKAFLVSIIFVCEMEGMLTTHAMPLELQRAHEPSAERRSHYPDH